LDGSRKPKREFIKGVYSRLHECARQSNLVGESIEIKFVRYPGLEGECLPVFTDELSWRAFLPVLQDYDEVHHMPAVNVYRFIIEEMPAVNTVIIDPARPDFLRVPRSTIEILAKAQCGN